MTTAVSAAALPLVVGWPYLASLFVAALAHRPSARGEAGKLPRLIVLVPAHDEAALVATCVDSLIQQSYPPARRHVIVIPDNCTAAPAAAAARARAPVLLRDHPHRRATARALPHPLHHLPS